jgi:two-component system heavy metal sensor histidine kinase CusS
MLENLRREMAQAQIFTAGLAHELRSPVQNLVGTTEVALIAERSPAAYRDVLHSQLDELHELGNAIDNLISICSAGSARKSTAREAFDLGEEADIRLHRERALAERRGIAFDLRTSGDLRLSGDREAILRAVRNLVDNAIQWTEPGGRVDVALTGMPEEVRVLVDDTGPGVPHELRQRIFEPFFHRSAAARPGTGSKRIGYGLGLGMVRSALLNQGGDVEVDTSPGGGARFVALLPREAPPGDEPTREARRSA